VKSSTKAHLFILLANVIYGINYPIGKIVLKSIDPFGIVLIRVFSCMFLFWMIHAIFIKEKTVWKDHIMLVLAAAFGVAINQLLFFKGLSLTSETHASLIMITTPLIVLLMGWVIAKDKITLLNLIGILVGGAGVGLLVSSGHKDSASASDITGDLFIVINATCYAIFLVITKPLMKKYSPFTVTKWIFIYGLIMVVPFGIKEFMDIPWQTLSNTTYASLIYVVLGATFFAYLFNVLGLRYGNPTLVSIYIYIQPVIASLIAVVAKTDTFTLSKFISAILVFLGVALVSFTGNKKTMKQTV